MFFTTRWPPTHRERTLPLKTVAFLQKLPGHRLAQAEFAALSEFNHAPNGFAAVFPIEAAILRKTGERGVKHFLYRAVKAAGQLLLDDLLLLGFEFDRHTYKLAPSTGSCKRGAA
jgi:hypothetical protein